MALINQQGPLDATSLGDPCVITLGFTPSAGNLLVVVGEVSGPDVPIFSSRTDNASNTYEYQEQTTNFLFAPYFIAAARAGSVPTTITLQPNGGIDFGTIWVLEFDGLAAAGTIIQDSDFQFTDGGETSTESPEATVTFGQAAGLLLALGGATGGGPNTVDDLYTEVVGAQDFPTIAYKVVASAGPHTGQIIIGAPEGGGDADILLFALLQEAAAAGPLVTAFQPNAFQWLGFQIGGLPFDGNVTMPADAGVFLITGTAASLERGLEVLAESGAFLITGTAASLERGYEVAADPGSVLITGTAAGVLAAREVAADPGSVTISGTAATLAKGRTLLADPGSVVISGTDASLEAGREVQADPGSVTISGTAASLERGLRLVADAGSFVLSGTAASLEKGSEVAADPGSVLITGTDAALSVADNPVLNAEAGAVLLSGTAAALRATFRLVADAGSVAVTGTDAGVLAVRDLAADPGAVTISGTAAGLSRGLELLADPGAITISGTAAALAVALRLLADPGAVLITGTDAGLVAGAGVGPADEDRRLEARAINRRLDATVAGVRRLQPRAISRRLEAAA